MDRRNAHIESIELPEGFYSIFYNDFTGNWFVKEEGGVNPRRLGTYRNREECLQAIEADAGK